jgi:Domain of unknown function (DUF6766)
MTREAGERAGVRGFVRENSLSLFFLAIFLAALAGQAISGHALYNQDQVEHHEATISFWRYLSSSHFTQGVMENWQSEYLQFALFALATVWLLQKGSPESKPLDRAGLESDQRQKVGGYADESSPGWARTGGIRTVVYSNSLIIVMAMVFLGSWLAQSFSGWTVFNQDQTAHHLATVSWWSYLGSSDFWNDSFQNWQSEFLAVGSFSVLAIYLRQRGSPESKPVGAETEDETGSGG